MTGQVDDPIFTATLIVVTAGFSILVWCISLFVAKIPFFLQNRPSPTNGVRVGEPWIASSIPLFFYKYIAGTSFHLRDSGDHDGDTSNFVDHKILSFLRNDDVEPAQMQTL